MDQANSTVPGHMEGALHHSNHISKFQTLKFASDPSQVVNEHYHRLIKHQKNILIKQNNCIIIRWEQNWSQ